MSEEKEVEKKVNLEGFAASVELPEGHQLVLGELAPGTVVEIATWQGTGRPDETTNRFLLSASGPGLQRRQRKGAQGPNEIDTPIEKEIEKEIERNLVTPSQGSVVRESSYLGMKTFGVDVAPAVVQAKSFSGASLFGGLLRFTIGAAGTITISALVLALLGISAAVPTNGAKTVLGPSTWSLVVYKKSPSVEIGNPTVAIDEVNGVKKIFFGPSNSFDETTLQIETTAGQELVPVDAVAGRGFLAFPLLGIIAKPFIG